MRREPSLVLCRHSNPIKGPTAFLAYSLYLVESQEEEGLRLISKFLYGWWESFSIQVLHRISEWSHIAGETEIRVLSLYLGFPLPHLGFQGPQLLNGESAFWRLLPLTCLPYLPLLVAALNGFPFDSPTERASSPGPFFFLHTPHTTQSKPEAEAA